MPVTDKGVYEITDNISKIFQKDVIEINTDKIDLQMKRFWKGRGVVCNFALQPGAFTSSKDMSIALARNEYWKQNLQAGAELTIFEPYGHDGADTLSLCTRLGID